MYKFRLDRLVQNHYSVFALFSLLRKGRCKFHLKGPGRRDVEHLVRPRKTKSTMDSIHQKNESATTSMTQSAELSQKLYHHPDAFVRFGGDESWYRRVAKATNGRAGASGGRMKPAGSASDEHS
jgi:hypothetical protein